MQGTLGFQGQLGRTIREVVALEAAHELQDLGHRGPISPARFVGGVAETPEIEKISPPQLALLRRPWATPDKPPRQRGTRVAPGRHVEQGEPGFPHETIEVREHLCVRMQRAVEIAFGLYADDGAL